MLTKPNVILYGLSGIMRPVLIEAERIYKDHGHFDGVIVTSGLDGVHSAGSLHYYGLALDFGIHPFTSPIVDRIVVDLRLALGNSYDVVLEKDHIHVEYDPD